MHRKSGGNGADRSAPRSRDRPSLDDVLRTEELNRRCERRPDHAAENRALSALAAELAQNPQNLLSTLVERVRELAGGADSVGVSIVEPEGDGEVFRWKAVSGPFSVHVGEHMPRDWSPCAIVLEQDAPLLFDRPGRRFPELANTDPPVCETLLVPFHVAGTAVGTLWVVGHTPDRHFDAEDARLLESLSRFAAAGYQVNDSLEQATTARRELERRVKELARLSEARRRSEQRLRLVSNHVPALISYVGRDGVYRFNNQRYEEWFGTPAGQVTGRHMRDVLGEEDYQQRVPYVARALRGEAVHFEGPTKHHRFGRRDAEIAYVPDLDVDGAVRGFYVMAFDVTERKRAENALRDSERRYRAIVEGQTEMVCRFRPDGRLLFVNGAYARSRGTTPEELTGTNLWDFVTAEDRPAVRNLLDRLRPGQPEIRIENRFETTDGPRWTLWTNRALAFDSRGRAVEVQSSGVDITERKRAEEALREADRRKDEFLALLGHELRNPLAAVVNGVQMLGNDRLDPEKTDQVREIIERQARQMTHLVDDLLDVTRISRGKISLRRCRLDLAELLAQVADDHRGLFEEAGSTFEVSLGDRPLWCDGDATRLTQIVGNLLHNASKFTDPGGRVALAAAASGDGRSAVVTVEDTGVGMEADLLARLFIPFSQAEVTLDRSRGGLGLGLALVQGLVELHGGSITADSPGIGRGSTFRVQLPLAEPETAAVASASTDTSANRCGAHRILVVEDSAAVARIFAMMLQNLGHEVRIAVSGEDALEQLGEYEPDVVFSDISMPGMSGYDLAENLRRQPRFANVFLVATTGYGQPEDRERALDAGFDEHMVKPADMEQLERLFARLASR